MAQNYWGGQLKRNVIFALGQSVFVTLCLFLIYRLVVRYAGLGDLGIWSLLMASVVVARVGDISGSGALARFVAIAVSEGNHRKVTDYIHTVLITSVGINLVLAGLLYFVGRAFIPHVLEPDEVHVALALLPLALVTFVVTALAQAVLGGLDGANRSDVRALLVSICSAGFLATGVWVIPEHGILGLAYAQILQQTLILVVGWAALGKMIRQLGILPHRWRLTTFKETVTYSVKLNGIGLLAVFFEPLAKFSFNHVGGTSTVAIYEMASRIVQQVRGAIVSGAMPLVPAFASIKHSEFSSLGSKVRALRLRFVKLALLCLVVSTVGAPVASLVVLETVDPLLVKLVLLLAIGWAVNIVAVPWYLAGQAWGVLRWNFSSHAAIAALVAVGAALASEGEVINLACFIVAGLVLGAGITLAMNPRALLKHAATC